MRRGLLGIWFVLAALLAGCGLLEEAPRFEEMSAEEKAVYCDTQRFHLENRPGYARSQAYAVNLRQNIARCELAGF